MSVIVVDGHHTKMKATEKVIQNKDWFVILLMLWLPADI